MARKYGSSNPSCPYGYVPDPEEHARTAFHVLKVRLGIVSAAVVGAANLASFAPAVMDQGQTGSCTGHGTSGACVTSLARAGKPLAFVPSQKGIYDVGRCIDRALNLGGTLPKLTDDGAQPNQVERGIAEWGVRATRAPTADGRNSDCDPATINEEPTLGDLEADSVMRLVGSYAIDSAGEQAARDVCLALDHGIAVGVGFFADAAFEGYDPGGAPVAPPDTNDPNGGGHWVYCYGYYVDAAGETVFLCRNSWGASWGIAGDFKASAAWMQASWQRIAFAVRQEAA